MIGITQVIQSALAAQLVYSETSTSDFPLFWISVACALAIGAYVPVSAARSLVQAKRTLDQCSTDVRRLS
jgi:hypothetical protein